MLERHLLSDESMIRCLHTHYGIEVVTLTFLPLGADVNAAIYKAQTPGQTPYFIKLKHGHHHDAGTEIVELLWSAGIQPIIPPVKTLHGKATQRIDNFTLMVYPFIDGQDGFNRNLTDKQWIALGKALRQVHELEVPLPVQTRIRKEAYSSQWRDAMGSIYTYLEADPITDEVGLKLQNFIKKTGQAFACW